MGNGQGRRGDMEEQLAHQGEPSAAPGLDDKKYICYPGQVCYERILPQDEHLMKPPPPPPGVPEDVELILPLDAVGHVNKIWRKNDLSVFFMQRHPQEGEILAWAGVWSQHCAIQFHQVFDAQKSDIRIDFKNSGSWSYIGTDSMYIPKESQTMNLGHIDRAGVLHEFGHALGLIHEHQSPFEGGFEWNRDAVIKSMMGPPNYWDLDRIENNFFKRYKRSDLDGTKYDPKSIMHYSFPPDWIKGNQFPRGIERNDDLSRQDIVHIRKLYGPPRGQPGGRVTPVPRPSTGGRGGRGTSVTPGVVVEPGERRKPVTDLPPPRTDKIYDVQAFMPHRGSLSGAGAELFIRFHTDKDARPQYTILTHGDCDVIVALLGPDDWTKVIKVSDDDAGDGKNAKIVQELLPDRDYYLQIQTFKPEGGSFEFSITGW